MAEPGCVCGCCQTLTALELLPVLAPEQEICESSALGVCASEKEQQHQHSLSRKPASLREGAAELLQTEGVQRENLGMLINPPSGRYLLGKCLAFICISAVKKKAFTFSPAQQSRRVGGCCDQTARGAGGAQPAPGILGREWKNQLKLPRSRLA